MVLLGDVPGLQRISTAETGFRKEHIKAHIARLTQKRANFKKPQNRLLHNPSILSPGYLRALTDGARKIRKRVDMHSLNPPKFVSAVCNAGTHRGALLYVFTLQRVAMRANP